MSTYACSLSDGLRSVALGAHVSMVSVKRDLLQCQKRPTTVSKETCYSVKRVSMMSRFA